MNGLPLGGISMIINLIMLMIRSITSFLFPSHTPRSIKTKDMPLTSLAVLVGVVLVVFGSAAVILDQGIESNTSNYEVVEDISQNKPIILPCLFVDKNCVITDKNLSTIASF